MWLIWTDPPNLSLLIWALAKLPNQLCCAILASPACFSLLALKTTKIYKSVNVAKWLNIVKPINYTTKSSMQMWFMVKVKIDCHVRGVRGRYSSLIWWMRQSWALWNVLGKTRFVTVSPYPLYWPFPLFFRVCCQAFEYFPHLKT